jgi:hypothetical protein
MIDPCLWEALLGVGWLVDSQQRCLHSGLGACELVSNEQQNSIQWL